MPKKILTNQKLELAMTIKKLRAFSDMEIAQAFGVTRQAIDYQYKQELKTQKKNTEK